MNFTRSTSTLLMLVMVLGLQACGGGGGGGGGGGTPLANANPIGYYTGTLSTVSPAQNPVNASAKAIVDSDKFMLVHIDNAGSNTLLYVGTFTNITATTFTADVRIYLNGAFQRAANITNGSIIEKSSMSGTLSGVGNYTATSFSLTYDTTINGRTPLVSSVSGLWLVPTTNQTGLSFGGSSTIANAYQDPGYSAVPDALKGCGGGNFSLINVNSEQLGRIKKFVASYGATSSCTNYTVDFTLTGYITPFDQGGTDNRYLWITYNDNVFFATDELVKQ